MLTILIRLHHIEPHPINLFRLSLQCQATISRIRIEIGMRNSVNTITHEANHCMGTIWCKCVVLRLKTVINHKPNSVGLVIWWARAISTNMCLNANHSITNQSERMPVGRIGPLEIAIAATCATLLLKRCTCCNACKTATISSMKDVL